MDAETLKKMFDESHKKAEGHGKIDFSREEEEKFKKAFDDPEFRKMFSEYMVQILICCNSTMHYLFNSLCRMSYRILQIGWFVTLSLLA